MEIFFCIAIQGYIRAHVKVNMKHHLMQNMIKGVCIYISIFKS